MNASESMSIDDEEQGQNNDRELIFEFLADTKEVQKALEEMDANNEEMTTLVADLITDKKSPANQKILQDQISGYIGEN